MSISLGLQRISRLLARLGNPQNSFEALHVAGTNGKGSVCAYLSSVLTQAGMRPGKFTSPHMFQEADAISINDEPISADVYDFIRTKVDSAAIDSGTEDATPFERHTAAAFLAFKVAEVKTAVIEVGLGGREDATNVLRKVKATAITKVALDHQGFLGNSLSEIAYHKAGIVKSGVPCFVDGTNDRIVLDVVAKEAERVGAPLHIAQDTPLPDLPLLRGSFQHANASVAYSMLTSIYKDISSETILKGFEYVNWPGRLQLLSENLLVDGAHNPSAAVELRKYVDEVFQGPIHWVVAFSKPCDEILPILLRDGDRITATTFGPVEGMPWVKPEPVENIVAVAGNSTERASSIEKVKINDGEPTVVCGSLYLVGEFLKYHLK